MEAIIDGQTVKHGEHRYDYKRQCWLKLVPGGDKPTWVVEPCGHTELVGCYACLHAGEIVVGTKGIH